MRSNPKISSFKDPLFFEELLKYHDASYLRWNRLTDKQQRQFKEFIARSIESCFEGFTSIKN